MAVSISPVPVLRFVDGNGNALVGGFLYTYAAGTTTQQATYTDSSGVTPNTNPIVLNGRGECSCWLDPSLTYDFKLTDANNNVIGTYSSIASGNVSSQWFLQQGTGAVIRSAQAKMRDVISALDFGCDNTGNTNTAATLQQALNAAVAAKKPLYIPAGTYELGSGGISSNVGPTYIIGDGRSTILRRTSDSSTEAILVTGGITDVRIENLMVYTPAASATVINSNAGVHVQGCTDVLVKNVYVAGLFYEGIVIESCIKSIVTGCEVRGPQNRCLYAYLNCSDVTFENNIVDGSNYGGTTATSDYGINVNPGGGGNLIDGILITGNTVRNTTHQGIAISENTRNGTVTGNSVTGVSQFYGILVQKANSVQGGFCTVTGNAVKSCGQHAIYISESFYVSVIGNICFSNTGDGISLFTAQNCSVVGNVCDSNAGNGLNLETNCSRNILTSNQLVNNTAKGLVIGTADCSFNRYNDNYVYNNTGGTISDVGTSSSVGTNLTT